MFTVKFAKDLVERMVASGAGVLVPIFGASMFNLFTLPVKDTAGIVLGAMAFSFVKGLAASKVGDSESASLVS